MRIKEKFTFTIFEKLLFEGRLVLRPVLWITGKKRVKFFSKTRKK